MRRQGVNGWMIWVAMILLASPAALWAQGLPGGLSFGGQPKNAWDVLDVQVIPQQTSVTPGQTVPVALDIQILDGWVFYGPTQNPQHPVKPSSLTVQAGNWSVGTILWPRTKTKPVDLGDKTVYVSAWTGRVWIYVPLSVPADAPAGPQEVSIRLDGQVCQNVCLDLQLPWGDPHMLTTTLTVADQAVENSAWTDDLQAGWQAATENPTEPPDMPTLTEVPPGAAQPVVIDQAMPQSLLAALGVAVVAGLVLNIMPCVLPVIPIRILTIVRLAGEKRAKYVSMGLAFAGGVLVFFAAIAVLNIVLKLAIGQAVNLNDAFNHPPIVVAMAAVLVAMAANLFGLFNVLVPGKLAGLETGQSTRGEHLRAVGMGFMLALLATPCSFAFLATAVAYAQVAPLWKGTAVILAIGLGMAAPHALLAAFPSLVDRLPKPGRWMELFKQSSGFLLLLVAVWLVASLRGDGSSYPFWVIAWCVLLAMGLWMWASWVRYDAPAGRKWTVRALAAVLVVGTGWFMLPLPSPALVQAEPFDPDAVSAARLAGRPVVVKFESNACIKCYQQEISVYNTSETAQLFAEHDVAYFKGNISSSPQAARWMAENGFGSSVPLTVVYSPGDDPTYRATHDLDFARLADLVASSR